jgi:hypothetical protein
LQGSESQHILAELIHPIHPFDALRTTLSSRPLLARILASQLTQSVQMASRGAAAGHYQNQPHAYIALGLLNSERVLLALLEVTVASAVTSSDVRTSQSWKMQLFYQFVEIWGF